MANLIKQVRDSGAQPTFRVWAAGTAGMDFYAVDSPEEARELIRKLALSDLEDENVEWNAFGLEELEPDGYHEWYDDMGLHDITHNLFEEEEAQP